MAVNTGDINCVFNSFFSKTRLRHRHLIESHFVDSFDLLYKEFITNKRLFITLSVPLRSCEVALRLRFGCCQSDTDKRSTVVPLMRGLLYPAVLKGC